MLQVLWGPSGSLKEAKLVGGEESVGRSLGKASSNSRGPGGKGPRRKRVRSGRPRGRPKKGGLLRYALQVSKTLSGPKLYQGFGQRKRAERQSRLNPVNRSYTPGSRRIPTADAGRFDFGRRRYPSISRVE